jgi:hypothetical protein
LEKAVVNGAAAAIKQFSLLKEALLFYPTVFEAAATTAGEMPAKKRGWNSWRKSILSYVTIGGC